MAEVLQYRSKLEKDRRAALGDPVVISMRNACDAELKRLQVEQRNRQYTTALAVALRQIYMTYGDTSMSDAIKINADIEARKILSCQT